MLLNRIAMFLLLIMVFLTGFLHCLRLNTPSFLSLINYILSDSDNSNNNNSGSSDNSNNNNSGSSDNSNNNNSGSSDDSNNNNSSSSDDSNNNNSGSSDDSNNNNSSSSDDSNNNNSGSSDDSNNNNSSSSDDSNNNNSGSSDDSNNNNSSSSGNTFTGAIGVLDTSFNSPNGFIIQPIGSSDDWGRSLAIQPDGKILLGGFCQGVSNYDFCIARFNSNGTLDTSFGSSGIVIQDIGSSDDYGHSLAIQPDGKILLSGACYDGSNIDFCIARFKSDGTLDINFGNSGKLTLDIGSSSDFGYSLAIQSDGKILLGGYCYNGSNNDFCIARFNSNGTLDTSFGSSGIVIQPIGSSDDYGYSLVIQPDGKILLGGICQGVSNNDFCIARFNSNGTLDTSFGSSGIVIQPIGSSDDIGYSLAIQSDGKILLGGYCYTGSYYDLCIARYNSNGTLDTTFGSSGKVIQPISSSYDDVYSLAIQPDGKILLGGFCYNGSNGDFCIARFNSNGTLDTSFGTNGKVTQPIGSSIDEGYSLVIQPDGKILLGGACSNGSNSDFCIARFK
jgi:uncharacterized delta-60 repeat protein